MDGETWLGAGAQLVENPAAPPPVAMLGHVTSMAYSGELDRPVALALLSGGQEHRSMTTLREKLVKIGAKVVRQGRYDTFQLAEVAVPRELFRKTPSMIGDLRRRPTPA